MTTSPTSSEAGRFEDVFEAFPGRVFAVGLGVTGNHADAEDASQETFLAVYRGLPRFRGDFALSTWIYRIAVRSALRVRARRPRTQALDGDPAGPFRDPALQDERSRQVRRALSRLTVDHAIVLTLFSIDGLSHREIAETLGIPEGTVWSRLHLARKKLTEELKVLGYET